jgi:hypothetical protein
LHAAAADQPAVEVTSARRQELCEQGDIADVARLGRVAGVEEQLLLDRQARDSTPPTAPCAKASGP